MKTDRGVVLLGVLAGLMALAACERAPNLSAAFPQNLTREAVCAVDGMILMDHPGPKGQILLKEGETRYYCDLREFFEALNDPALKPRIARRWVQPFDDRSWTAHEGDWAEPDDLVFVLGSRRQGAMGPTLVPFRAPEAARRFTQNEGGRIVPAAELTRAILEAYAAEIRESMRSQGPMAPMSPQGGMNTAPHGRMNMAPGGGGMQSPTNKTQ